MVDAKLKDAFAKDIVLLNFIGIKPVIVHGGGPKINRIMERMGKTPTFVHGQRVTDKETVDIVENDSRWSNKQTDRNTYK